MLNSTMPATAVMPVKAPADVKAPSRTAVLYVIIVTVWVLLSALLARADWTLVRVALHYNIALGLTLAANTAFIAYFWLNGVRDVASPLAYRLIRPRRVLPPRRPAGDGRPPI